MIVGGILLTAQDAINKWLIGDYHVGEIMFYRCIFMLLPVLVVLAWPLPDGGSRWPSLRPRQPVAVAIRSVVSVLASWFVVLSFAYMPLADALTLIFLSPLILTAMSVPMLGEAVGWRRWAAVLVGFAGMLLIVKPGGDGFGWFALIPVLGATGSAVRDGLTRLIGIRDTTVCLMFYTTVATGIAGLVSLPFGVHWPSLVDWGLFAAAGVLASISMFFITRAFQVAEAAAMSPFKYLSLVWAALLGYWIWDDVTEAIKIAGAALVVASGLYILHRETVLHRRNVRALSGRR
jgi:drug/metabolite transporter (DMT)-like permease